MMRGGAEVFLKATRSADVLQMKSDNMRPEMPPAVQPTGTVPVAGEIETVIATHETPLLRYAARLLNNADLAQDAVQTAFIRLCDAWAESRSWTETHLRAWLYRTTHNAALDLIRKEERLKKLHAAHANESTELDPPRQDEAMELADRQKLALDALAGMENPDREILILRLQQGLSYAEIAEITGRSEGNVGCILSNAAKELARRLHKTGAVVT